MKGPPGRRGSRPAWLTNVNGTLVKNNQDYAVLYPSGDEFRDEVTDRVPVESGDFYYLRVLQEDHNMGWASPIWIDLSDSTNGRVPEVSSSCALW